jgi:protein-S-isoprenylcysteine O-methyltransferase Ste14
MQQTSGISVVGLSSTADWLRGSRLYDLASRAFGATWFLALAIFIVQVTISNLYNSDISVSDLSRWPTLLSQAGLTAFYFTLWLLMILRPAPTARAHIGLPGIAAMAGTYMPWLLMLFPARASTDATSVVGTALTLIGIVLTLRVLWHLGRSFSIVPQARKLVTSGPYALVRHPLYITEEIMVIGATLLHLSALTVALTVLHATIQASRMLYEEQVLETTFPDYATYKSRTWRVLPGIW